MNEDVRFLVDKARENLEATDLLAKQGYIDIAASRAYYVMFYLAEALLQQRNQTFSSHSAVIAAFGKEFARTKDLDPKFHQYLIKSQQLRQTGDYGHHESVSDESIAEVIGWAREFYKAVLDYLNREPGP
jgi:uncharacterized protein (UPF0332 family)